VEEVLGMIKANELRIGNKVDYYGNIVTINYINDTDVGFSDYVPFDYPLLDEINPIPITDEWLVRLGFEEDGPEWYWLSVKDKLTSIGYSYSIKRQVIDFCEIEITITHVHQLQNLYFALTGEELKYG
jgi:hypothetical protein